MKFRGLLITTNSTTEEDESEVNENPVWAAQHWQEAKGEIAKVFISTPSLDPSNSNLLPHTNLRVQADDDENWQELVLISTD